MKKFFTLVMALVAVMAVNAKQVVFDFTNPEALSITAPAAGAGTNITAPVVVEDVTLTVTNGSTATRIWNSNGVYDLRTYKNGTLTFTATENITAIEFTGKSVSFSEFSGKTWKGEAQSVTFTATATCNINTITLTIGEAAQVWTPDTVEVSAAIQLAKDGDTHDHFVKGVVKGQPFTTYAFKDKVSFWMYDAENPTDTIEFYDGMGKDNQKWESLEAAQWELRIGDTILVYAGGLSMYTPKGTDISFAEITGGYYVEKLGANPEAPDPIIVEPDTIDVATALDIIGKLDKGGKTAETYIVKGFAGTAYPMEDGKQTWYMADEPGAYATFQAATCTPDREVVKGDYMLVKGVLTKYEAKSGNIIPEIYNGTAVHGVAPKLDTTYVSVAEALAVVDTLQENETAKAFFGVTGYAAKVSEAEDGVQSFRMSDDETAETGGLFIKLAKIDLPVSEHQKVCVYGRLTKMDGAVIVSGKAVNLSRQGIEQLVLTEKAQKVVVDGAVYIIRDNKLFNLQGAQVR